MGVGVERAPNRCDDVNQLQQTAKILVVDDEDSIVQTLRFNLEQQGFAVATARDGPSALARAKSDQPDLIVLDLMLPGMDGVEVCRQIRKTSSVPVVMLTAKDREIDKVVGLEIGADDYITKPFSIHELMARIKAQLRRAAAPAGVAAILRGADIEMDVSRHRATKRGQQVELSPKEFRLLQVLLENKGHVVSRETLLDRVWGYDFDGNLQTVSVHMHWLREKIEDDPGNPQHLVTVRSRGYVFRE